METELRGDLIERNTVVARILVFLEVTDLGIGDELLDLFNDHGFLIVLFRTADVVHVESDFVRIARQRQPDGLRKILNMAIGPPKLLAEYLELSSQGEFLGEFVNREVEAHTRRQTVNRRKPQANRTEAAIPGKSIQDGLLDLNLEFRIERT